MSLFYFDYFITVYFHYTSLITFTFWFCIVSFLLFSSLFVLVCLFYYLLLFLFFNLLFLFVSISFVFIFLLLFFVVVVLLSSSFSLVLMKLTAANLPSEPVVLLFADAGGNAVPPERERESNVSVSVDGAVFGTFSHDVARLDLTGAIFLEAPKKRTGSEFYLVEFASAGKKRGKRREKEKREKIKKNKQTTD